MPATVWRQRSGALLNTFEASGGAAPDRHHLATGRRLGAELGPCIHKLAPLVEQVRSAIGGLDRGADAVRERHLCQLAGKARALRGPVAKGRAEAVNSQIIALHPAQDELHCL